MTCKLGNNVKLVPNKLFHTRQIPPPRRVYSGLCFGPAPRPLPGVQPKRTAPECQGVPFWCRCRIPGLYVEEAKTKGFDQEQDTQDAFEGFYTYTAKNADGYKLEITLGLGTAGLNIRKP